MPFLAKPLVVGGRNSPLSQAQVLEVYEEIQRHHPTIKFKPLLIATTGDKDLKTSLRTMNKTNFFSKEVDTLLLEGKCRIAIHSAKDLPEPIPDGLRIIAVTKGIDASDSLVLRAGVTLETLPPGAIIATSSKRREETVRKLRSNLHFIDLRGTINQRLAKLETKEADGTVIAEAALIRLGLTHRNRIRLPGETTPCQGQLAVLARDDDAEIQQLFSCIDSRKTTLYLGLNAPKEDATRKILHYPTIKIIPRDPHHPHIEQMYRDLYSFTHILFTSKTTVRIFFDYLKVPSSMKDKKIIAVGKKTGEKIQEKGVPVTIIPQNESSEGIIEVLEKMENLHSAHLLWPHSSLSRPLLSQYFTLNNIAFREVVLYDTHSQQPSPLPSPNTYHEIIFTSPSTVDAFKEFFGEIPDDKIITPIGPITDKKLQIDD